MRILALGGGGLRTAFQVPIVERLLDEYSYDLIVGISAGAVNGALAASGRVDWLRDEWEGIGTRMPLTGVSGLWSVSGRPWSSLFSLGPLRRRLVEQVSLDDLHTPLACGVVVRETHAYRALISSNMTEDRQLHGAITASSAIAGLMPPVRLKDARGSWTLVDGGHRHSVPPVPSPWAERMTHLDAIYCMPLETHEEPVRPALLHAMAWALENHLESFKALDLERMRLRAVHGVHVRIWAPSVPIGRVLDARPDVIQQRLRLGEEARAQPVLELERPPVAR